jgi:hypothetical protein
MRTRSHWLVRLLVVVVILAALLEGADVLARHVAEDTIAARAVRATGASAGSSHISGWPVLYDFAVDDEIPSVSLDLQNVPIKTGAVTLTVEEVDVVLTKVGVSAGDLVGHRELRLTGISQANVRAVVTDGELSAAAGVTVELLPGGLVRVETPDGLLTATVGVVGSVLTVSTPSRQLLHIDLTQDRLIPRCTMTTSLSVNQLTASCTIAPVPPSVLAALSSSP